MKDEFWKPAIPKCDVCGVLGSVQYVFGVFCQKHIQAFHLYGHNSPRPETDFGPMQPPKGK